MVRRGVARQSEFSIMEEDCRALVLNSQIDEEKNRGEAKVDYNFEIFLFRPPCPSEIEVLR